MKSQGFRKNPNSARASWERAFLLRLQEVTANSSFRRIGDLTGVHPETVRRYLKQGRPSAFFVASLGRAFGLSPEWLVYGSGPRLSRPAVGPGVEPKSMMRSEAV